MFSSLGKWFGSKPVTKKAGPKIDLAKRFDLMGRIGQGSMSKVYRARDRSLGRTVCLKVLDKEKTAKFEARFKGVFKPTEGEIGYQLRHPNIVQTYEHGVSTDGHQFLVMELIEGVGLNYLVETRHAQLEGNRVNYLVQLSQAIEAVHNQGFVHRDICPRNVMVTKGGVVKLIDFGLTIPQLPYFLKPGNRTGTPNYLAPEVIRRGSTDARVDLFAMGVTAYQVFTYALPWEKSVSLQTLLSHMNSPGKNAREIRPDLDDATFRFLTKAIEREPKERYQSAADFRIALQTLPVKS